MAPLCLQWPFGTAISCSLGRQYGPVFNLFFFDVYGFIYWNKNVSLLAVSHSNFDTFPHLICCCSLARWYKTFLGVTYASPISTTNNTLKPATAWVTPKKLNIIGPMSSNLLNEETYRNWKETLQYLIVWWAGTPGRSTLEEHPGGAPWRSTLEEHPGGAPWRSTLEEHPGGAPWRSTLKDHPGRAPLRSTLHPACPKILEMAM